MTHFTRWKTSPGRRRPTTDRGGRVCPERVEFMVFVWQIGEFGDTTRKWIKIDDCELCDLSKLSVWPLYHGGVRSEITVKDTHSKLLSSVAFGGKSEFQKINLSVAGTSSGTPKVGLQFLVLDFIWIHHHHQHHPPVEEIHSHLALPLICPSLLCTRWPIVVTRAICGELK